MSLDSDEMKKDLQWFKEIVQSSYGPFGKYVVHHNLRVVRYQEVIDLLIAGVKVFPFHRRELGEGHL